VKLAGKVALITGAGRGIGAALAEAFAREGAAVVVNYSRSANAADEVVARIQQQGGRAVAVRGDVGVLADHDALLDAARHHFGGLHILVNNAAIDRRTPILEATPEQWDAVQAVDLRGPFFLAQAAARHMKDHGGGAILNISSVHDEQAHRNNAIYTIAKGGLKLMTRCMALELAPYGIRVNALSPGAFLTDINREVLKDDAYRQRVEAHIPLARIGDPRELAAAAVLLVSADGSYITGSTFYVDGGLLL
jgi:glucose 1-dehydrogenase